MPSFSRPRATSPAPASLPRERASHPGDERRPPLRALDHLGVEPDAEACPEAPRAEAQARGARAVRGRGRGSGSRPQPRPRSSLSSCSSWTKLWSRACWPRSRRCRIPHGSSASTAPPTRRVSRARSRRALRLRPRQRWHAAARRRRVRRSGRALRRLRRPARVSGGPRLGRGDLPRSGLLPFEETPGSRVALVAHGAPPLAEVDLSGPVSFLFARSVRGCRPRARCGQRLASVDRRPARPGGIAQRGGCRGDRALRARPPSCRHQPAVPGSTRRRRRPRRRLLRRHRIAAAETARSRTRRRAPIRSRRPGRRCSSRSRRRRDPRAARSSRASCLRERLRHVQLRAPSTCPAIPNVIL